MEEQLKKILITMGFKETEIQLESAGAGKVGGVIISGRFDGQSQEERQTELWRGLRDNMSQEDLIRIVALLTMTPDEVA